MKVFYPLVIYPEDNGTNSVEIPVGSGGGNDFCDALAMSKDGLFIWAVSEQKDAALLAAHQASGGAALPEGCSPCRPVSVGLISDEPDGTEQRLTMPLWLHMAAQAEGVDLSEALCKGVLSSLKGGKSVAFKRDVPRCFIRKLMREELHLLKELHHGLLADGCTFSHPLPQDFGKAEQDEAVAVEVDGGIVGGAWLSADRSGGSCVWLNAALVKEYRHMGLGSGLISAVLTMHGNSGAQVRLSINKEHYALRLFARLGFQVVDETQGEYIMQREG